MGMVDGNDDEGDEKGLRDKEEEEVELDLQKMKEEL